MMLVVSQTANGPRVTVTHRTDDDLFGLLDPAGTYYLPLYHIR